MTPISRIVNSSRVSSGSDPLLSSDSILMKWRPLTVEGEGVESWDDGDHAVINISGGVFLSWLVNLRSEEIMGFVVQGQPVVIFSPIFPLTNVSSDPVSPTYHVYFIQQFSPRRLSHSRSDIRIGGNLRRSLSISHSSISILISPHQNLSSRIIRDYVPGVSDQHLYLLDAISL